MQVVPKYLIMSKEILFCLNVFSYIISKFNIKFLHDWNFYGFYISDMLQNIEESAFESVLSFLYAFSVKK